MIVFAVTILSLITLTLAVQLLRNMKIVGGNEMGIVSGRGKQGFSVISGVIFHGAPDQVNQIMLMKNIAIAGGFLVLAANGAGAWSLDAKLKK